MSAPRVRAISPSTSRSYLETPRASTGGLVMTQSYDTRYESRPRANFSTVATSREGPSSRNNSVYETQPVSKQTYTDRAHPGTITRTEYAVRPRRESISAESRRPLTIMTKNASPTRQRPQVLSPGAMVMYEPPRDTKDDAKFLQSSQAYQSPHHQRHHSASRADSNRYIIAPASTRAEREYHRRGPYVEKISNSHPPVRYSENDAPGSFSYTTPRQQFERDLGDGTGFRPNRRESMSRRDRPSSAMAERYEHVPHRNTTNPPPSSSSRQLERIEREDPRRSGFESDPDRSREPRRINPSERGPVVHQQREEGYSSAREDYDPYRSPKNLRQDDGVATVGRNRYQGLDYDRSRKMPREYERERNGGRSGRDRLVEREDDRRAEPRREREYERERERHRPRDYERIEPDDDSRRRPRSRETSPDHSGLKAAAATAAVGGLAAAGIAKHRERRDGEASDPESRRERRHRRRKSREHRDEEDRYGEPYDGERRRKERRSHSQGRDESSGSETPEDESRRQRPQSRTRRRRSTYDSYGDEKDGPQLALPAPEPQRRSSRVLEEAVSSEPLQDKDLEIVPERAQQQSPSHIDRKTTPPAIEDNPVRKPALVEPVKEKKEEIKPRGILKPPRTDPFPEDPNPQREGVAPLKQAGKDGISPGARWTKISRILVNPEALEKAQERYEERQDYVIVLRVLSKDEIEKLAERTREIRTQREREWQRQAEERQRYRSERGSTYPDDDDGYDSPRQLAIEAPPTAPPADLRQLAGQNQGTMAPPPLQSMPGGYGPRQWNNNPPSARNSGEQVPVPLPQQQQPPPTQHMNQARPPPQQQPEFDASTYSQNV